MSQYITPEELKTHVYDEELKEIIREDESIALASIDMAIEYAETQLGKFYNIDVIFSKTGQDRSTLLVGFIKDIAVWYLIGLCNPSIDYEDKKFRFQQASNWFRTVFKNKDMKLSSKDFPLLETNITVSFSYSSNEKRENRY